MKKIVLLSIILIFLITGISFAFQNEPDGFRGLKWGDPPTEDMTFLLQDESGEIFYTRPSDKMKIGNVEFSSIIYGFYKGQFLWVLCDFDKENDYENLMVICKERFGKPIIEEYHDTFWYGNKAWVKLLYYSEIIGGNLAIMSQIINKEEKAAKEDF